MVHIICTFGGFFSSEDDVWISENDYEMLSSGSGLHYQEAGITLNPDGSCSRLKKGKTEIGRWRTG